MRPISTSVWRDASERGLTDAHDPWGTKGKGDVRKPQISNQDSLDEIIRANNGGFVGLLKDF